MSKVKEILGSINKTDVKSIRLYIIFRQKKENVQSNLKMLDKYDFYIRKLEIDKSLQNELWRINRENIVNYLKEENDIKEYDIYEDEPNTIYTYDTKNKIGSFNKIIDNLKYPANIPSITDLTDLYDNIWAFCISSKYNNQDLFTFKRLYKQRVAIDKKGNGILKRISARFDTNTNKFELIEGESITFETNIDCVYFVDTFYIINKNNFESIVNIEQEYFELAKECTNAIKGFDFVEGIEIIEEEIAKNPTLNKKLARISENGYHKDITQKRIAAMKRIAKRFKLKINIDGDKIKINNSKDISDFIKLLDDYFVQSMQDLGYYGSHSKKKIKAES
jgi:hypothetical protein